MVWKCCNHALKAVTPGDIGVLCRKQWKMLRSYSSLVINCNNFKFGFTWIVVVMNKCPFLVGTSHSGHWMTRCVSGVSVVLWRSVPELLLCIFWSFELQWQSGLIQFFRVLFCLHLSVLGRFFCDHLGGSRVLHCLHLSGWLRYFCDRDCSVVVFAGFSQFVVVCVAWHNCRCGCSRHFPSCLGIGWQRDAS